MLGGCAYHSETMPPPQYQAIGTTTVAFSDDPATDCNMGNAVACTLGAVIIVPNPCIWANEFYASLLCHENAHRFGGWRHEKK
jgi:hypothetical protein